MMPKLMEIEQNAAWLVKNVKTVFSHAENFFVSIKHAGDQASKHLALVFLSQIFFQRFRLLF